MTQQPSAYLQSALNAAAAHTYRLAARFGLSSAEREDLQQDLILDLLEREHAFDPEKASANTFTGLVSRHRAVELLDRLIKDRMRLHFCGRAGEAANDPHLDDPDGHPKLLHLWPVKLLQAGRGDCRSFLFF